MYHMSLIGLKQTSVLNILLDLVFVHLNVDFLPFISGLIVYLRYIYLFI